MEMLKISSIASKTIILSSMPREKLPDFINIADVVVVPSLSEGFGFSAAEACSLGKKVVVTDVGSLPEVVHGRVVKVKKADPGAIAEGVLKAFRGGYTEVPEKKFLWDDSLRKYDEAINELIRPDQ
jgi:glycosyltransferase involved in cell wall biosynthesis